MVGKELAAGSNSKHPLVVKILIDVDQYRRLKALEKFEKEFYSKKNRELKTFHPSTNTENSSTASVSQPYQFEQSGSGIVNHGPNIKKQSKPNLQSRVNAVEERLRDSLSNALKEQFENFTQRLYSNLNHLGVVSNQQGGGEISGSVPLEPDLILSEKLPESQFFSFEQARDTNQVAGPPISTFTQKKNVEATTDNTLISDIVSKVPTAEKKKP